jgi:hypothetical protein
VLFSFFDPQGLPLFFADPLDITICADPGGLTVFVDTAKMRGEVWQDNRAVGCRGDAVRRLLCYNIRK